MPHKTHLAVEVPGCGEVGGLGDDLCFAGAGEEVREDGESFDAADSATTGNSGADSMPCSLFSLWSFCLRTS